MKRKFTLTLFFLGLTALSIYIAVSCKNDEEAKPELKLNVTTLIVGSEANSSDTITITSNVAWSVTSSETWLTVNPASGSNDGKVIVSAAQNPDTTSRTATVTITGKGLEAQSVSVTQSGTLALSVSQISIASSANSTATFKVFSTKSWTITSSESWLTVNPASGSNNATITVTAQENTGSTSRTATVTVAAQGSTAQNLTVKQITGLSSVKSLTLDYKVNSKGTFKIISDTTWTLTTEDSWLELHPVSGSKSADVVVLAKENTDTVTRSGKITITTADGISEFITVKQNGAILLSVASVTVNADANSTGTFTLSANSTWTITCADSWLTFNPASGSKTGTITVTAQKTAISRSRVATLTITTPTTVKTLLIVQKGIPCGADDEKPCDLSGCTVPAMPSYASLTVNEKLPDPFMFMNGTRMTTKDEWKCRRAEIAAMAQEYEYGYKPCTPYSATTATLNGTTLTVTVTGNEKTISFNCNITYPTGAGPFPAMIALGGSTIASDLVRLGVAYITFPCDDLAEQLNSSSRGIGKFYDFFCSNHSASATMAWAWGVSRLIDALEKTPSAKIDATHLGITGCSRNGKGALTVGAFDERIVLTLPQESGSGGAASWRVSDWQNTQGMGVQALNEITGENVWFRQNFSQFGTSATKLPYDHHMIEALVAPRALLVIENTSMAWLGNISCYVNNRAAHYVWDALGVPDKMGFSQYGHSDHCSYKDPQKPEVEAFVKKFLLGTGTDNTNIMKTDGTFQYDSVKWVNWTIPNLQ